jgi:pimeloyl-ACP methyl ester carboxylesterase
VDVLRDRSRYLVKEVEGGVAWKADPLHRTIAPFPFYASAYVEFAKRVTCPVLFVGGGPEGMRTPDEDARLASFPRSRREELPGAGHMMHWTRPADLAAMLLAFWRSD